MLDMNGSERQAEALRVHNRKMVGSDCVHSKPRQPLGYQIAQNLKRRKQILSAVRVCLTMWKKRIDKKGPVMCHMYRVRSVISVPH